MIVSPFVWMALASLTLSVSRIQNIGAYKAGHWCYTNAQFLSKELLGRKRETVSSELLVALEELAIRK